MSTPTGMNLFGSIVPNVNTTFLIDTSGSMYSCLATVREHLSAYLRVHAVDVPSPQQTILFNLIEFNSDVRRWADRSVFWSHASVVVADDWLRALVPKTGTNTLGGLITTFADSLCQQVVLVTDGIPDQEPAVILNFLQHKQQDKRPCHIFYINTPSNTDNERETVVKFLQDLAALTRGSLTIAHFTRTGVLEGVAPMINYQLEDATQALFVGDASLSEPLGPPMETAVSTEVGTLLIGQECLGRKDKDGYYYRGKILNQININQFTVEFGPRTSGGFSESDFQPTYLFDIIHYADALMHKIQTGDFVLAPDGQQGRFVPGEVLDGFEKRASCEQQEIRPLVIHFAHGKTVTLKRLQEAIWIPSNLYERIKFELALPPSARQFLQTHSVAYPNRLLPGYPMPTPAPAASNQWPFFLPDPQRPSAPVVLVQHQTAPASVNSFEVNNLIMSSQQKPDSLMTSHELNRKVDQQIKQHWFLLGERTPSASPRPSPPTAFAPLPPPHPNTHHHHHHPHPHQHQHQSHSTNSSPNPSNSRKKSVCFNDSSSLRRYSVDDLDISRQTAPLKSCLKSSVTLNDGRYSPIDMNRSVQTQATSMDTKPRPSSAVLSSHVHRSSSVPSSVEHWHARQLKSAPPPSHSHSSTTVGPHRQNLGHLYEKAQQEVKDEMYRQQVQREQYKRQQAQEQSQRIQHRQQHEAEKPERILETKRQYRSQVIHQNQQKTQGVESYDNDRLHQKQNQYAQRSVDHAQVRHANEQKNNQLFQRRQHDEARRIHTQHNNVLSQECDRLYKNVIARKFHDVSTRQASGLRNREERQVDLVRDIEKRRVAWSNPIIFS